MRPFSQPKRHFLISSLALAGCSTQQNFFQTQPLINNALNYSNIREPKIGQQWIYNVRNAYDNQIEDEITEVITQLTPEIEITRTSAKNGQLASEIHSNWGMVLQDPYWNPAVRFLRAIPLWPKNLDESAPYVSDYRVLSDPYNQYKWSSKLSRTELESLSINGIHFSVLKSSNHIFFQSNDYTRSDSYRTSTIWLSPEIGRWVVRTTNGHYFATSGGKGADRYESYLRYELKSWK
jgi:hypothetical protein